MIYATDACRYIRRLPNLPVRVEYRGLRAARWQMLDGVLDWDGVTLTVASVKGHMLVPGVEWRIDGVQYQQTRVQTSRPIQVTLRRTA